MRECDDLFFDSLVLSCVEDNPRFLRRDWLAEVVDGKLAEAGHDFVLLTGEPGAGKTAFMAQLAHDHPEWLRYFIRRDQRSVLADVSDKSLLLRLGYQLAARHADLFSQEQLRVSVEQHISCVAAQAEAVGAEVKRLIASPFYQKVLEIEQQVRASQGKVVGLRVEELVIEPRRLQTEDLLHLALIHPAWALQRVDPMKQIVILIDALDEIRYNPTRENILAWLTSCPELPENIRFVLTSRPPDEALRLFCDKHSPRLGTLEIAEEDPRVKEDIVQFVQQLVTEETLAKELAQTVGGAEGFARRVIDKASGNLGYVDALARGIDQAIRRDDRAGLQTLLSLKELPGNLGGLYAFFLHQVKVGVDAKQIVGRDSTGKIYSTDVWPAVYDRILGVLAVAMEPVDFELLERLGEIPAERAWILQALERLLQFLDVTGNRYRFYHATMAEFLTAEKTRANAETHDLYQDAQQWHRRIADHYWGQYFKDWTCCRDEYALRNLAIHLYHGEQFDRLHDLISQEWMNAQYRGQGPQSFSRDVDLAWQVALMSAQEESVTSLARLVRLKALKELVILKANVSYSELGICALARLGKTRIAVANARMRANPTERLRALELIYCALSSDAPEAARLPREMLALAQNFYEGPQRGAELALVAELLSKTGLFDEAEKTVLSFSNADEPTKQVDMINTICISMVAAGQMDRAVRLASTFTSKFHIATLDYARLIARLAHAAITRDPAMAKELFDRSIDAAKSLDSCDEQARALSSIAALMVPLDERKAQGLTSVAENSLNAPDEFSGELRTLAVLQLAVAKAKLGRLERLGDLSNLVAESERPIFRKSLPMVLADDGAVEGALQVLDDAQLFPKPEMAEGSEARAEALILIGEKLGEMGDRRADFVLQTALNVAGSLASTDERERDFCIGEVARVWAKLGNSQRALDAAHSMSNKWERFSTLSLVATAMARSNLLQEAVRVAQSIEWDEKRADTLASIAGELADSNPEFAARLLDRATGIFSFAWGRLISLTLGPMAYAMATIGYDDVAFRLVELIPTESPFCDGPRERAWGLLAETLAQKGSYDRPGRALNELARLPNCKSAVFVRECQIRVAIAQAGRGDVTAARHAWESICRDEAFGQKRKASWTVGLSRDEPGLALTLIEKLLAAGQLQVAGEFALNIRDRDEWETATVLVACALVKSGRSKEAVSLVREAKAPRPTHLKNEVFLAREREGLGATSLATFVGCLIEAGCLQDALLLVPTDHGDLFLCGPAWAKLGAELLRKADGRADELLRLACAAARIYSLLIEPRWHSEEYASIVACLMSVGDPRGRPLLESAPQEKGPALVLALVKHGLWDDAVNLAARLPEDWTKHAILARATKSDLLARIAPYVVMETGAEVLRLQTFTALVSTLRRPILSWRPMVELSLAMAKAGQLRAALELHPLFPGVKTRDEKESFCFLQSLPLIAPYFEKACPGFSLAALRQIAEVGTWMHSDWQAVRTLLVTL